MVLASYPTPVCYSVRGSSSSLTETQAAARLSTVSDHEAPSGLGLFIALSLPHCGHRNVLFFCLPRPEVTHRKPTGRIP